jgi:Ca2+-binding EF-hand superfamily protein
MVTALTLTLAASGGDDAKKGKGDFEAFFKKLDSNMDGKLNKEEFLKMAIRAKQPEKARQKLGQAYDKLDPEKKGVTKDQLKRFLDENKNGEPPPKTSN